LDRIGSDRRCDGRRHGGRGGEVVVGLAAEKGFASISFVVEGFAAPSLSLAVHGLDRMIADLPGSEACKTDAFLPCAVVQLSASCRNSPLPLPSEKLFLFTQISNFGARINLNCVCARIRWIILTSIGH
jgi:hypothetical protein